MGPHGGRSGRALAGPQRSARRCSLAPGAGPAGRGPAVRHRPDAGRGRGARPGRRWRRRRLGRGSHRRRRGGGAVGGDWVAGNGLSAERLPPAGCDRGRRCVAAVAGRPRVAARRRRAPRRSLGLSRGQRVVGSALVHPGPCRPLGRLGCSRPRPRRSRGHQPRGLVPSSRQGGQREGRGAEGLEQRLGSPVVTGGIGCPGRDRRCARTRGRPHGAGYRAGPGRCGAGRRDDGGLVVDAYPGCGVVGPPARRARGRGQPGCQWHRRSAVNGPRFCNVRERRACHRVAR